MKRFLVVLLAVLAVVAAFVLPGATAPAQFPGATCNQGTATAHASIPADVPGHVHVPCL